MNHGDSIKQDFILTRFKSVLFGNAAIYLGANILNAAIPFLLLPILTRVLTPADYGIVAMFGIVLSVLGAFTGLSVHGAIGVRYFQMQKNELAEYVGTCIGILVISTSFIFLLVVFFGSWLSAVTGVPLDWLLVAVVLSGLQFLGNIRLSLWQVDGQAKKYGAFQVSQSLLNACFSLIFILIVGMAWQGRILGQALAIGMSGVVALWWLLKDGLLIRPVTWNRYGADALKFGVPLIPHVIGALLIVAVDRFVIAKLLGIAQDGIYMVALQIGQAIGLLTESFNKAYSPWLFRKLSNATEELHIQIVRGTYLYFFIVLMGALTLGFIAPMLVRFLVGESFRDAGNFVIFIALGFAFGGCYFMVTNYLFYASKTSLLALITLASGIINIPLMFWLVGVNGLTGAGQAFMLSQAISFMVTWWLANKTHPMPWLQAIILR